MCGFSSVGSVEEAIVTPGDKWHRAIYKSGVRHRTTGAHNRRTERGSGEMLPRAMFGMVPFSRAIRVRLQETWNLGVFVGWCVLLDCVPGWVSRSSSDPVSRTYLAGSLALNQSRPWTTELMVSSAPISRRKVSPHPFKTSIRRPAHHRPSSSSLGASVPYFVLSKAQ